MKRRLLNLLTSLSMLLCTAAALSWIGSYRQGFSFNRSPYFPEQRQYRADMVQSHAGRLGLWFTGYTKASDEMDRQFRSRPDVFGERWRRLRGPSFGLSDPRPWERIGPHLIVWRTERMSGFAVTIPYWLIVALTLPLPAMRAMAAVKRRREIRRVQAGRCHHCGYDLQTTPERCPECGQPAAAFKSNSAALTPR